MAAEVFSEYKPQQSFWNQNPARYGYPGSVRLDLFREGSSIEVKNYNLGRPKNIDSMVRVISKQYSQRLTHIPEGTKQAVLIDIMGQNVSDELCMEVFEKISANTDGKMNVWFLMN